MGVTLQISPGEEDFLARHGLTCIDAVFAFSEGERLDKAGLERWRQRWRLRLPDARGQARTLYLKRFEQPPLRRQWERWRQGHVGQSTAGIEWNNARRLRQADIPAVQALAYGQDMTGAWERRSFVLLAEAAGESLERWLPGHWPADAPARRALLDRAAGLVARLHERGFVHRDLYLAHIFIQGESLRLIDLQRVFRPRLRRGRWMIKDLAALHFSTPADRVGNRDRLRFLCRYVRLAGRWSSARTLAARVDAKARRMARRRPPPAVGAR